jgi:hypothetical protein
MFQFHPDPNLGRRQQIFQIWIRPVEPQNAHFALRTAVYELGKLSREGMKQKDFEDTRRFLSKFVNVLAKTQDLQLGYQLDSRYYGIPGFAEYVKTGLAKLTLADGNRVIRENVRARTEGCNRSQGRGEAEAGPGLQRAVARAVQRAQTRRDSERGQDAADHQVKLAESEVKIIPVEQVLQ